MNAAWLQEPWYWVLWAIIVFAVGVYANWRREKRRARLPDKQLRKILRDGLPARGTTAGPILNAATPVVEPWLYPPARDYAARGPFDVLHSGADIGEADSGQGGEAS